MKAELSEGRNVETSLEVVLGHSVATTLKLQLGDTFVSSHGLVDNESHVHDDKLVVVGILKPTQKVIDRLILTNLKTVWDVHEHDNEEVHNDENDEHDHDDHENEEHHGEHDEHSHDHHHEDGSSITEIKSHEEHKHENNEYTKEYLKNKEVTSLLISFRNPVALLTFPRNINENTNMQAALPKFELEKLYKFTGVGLKTISWIAYFILVISGAIIFVSLYKMVKERKFELALMRTYGASNFQLVRIIAYEGFLIICVAYITGLMFSKIGIQLMLTYLDGGQQQLILQNLAFNEYLQIIVIVIIIVLLAVFLAIYPILRMNISNILSREV